MIYKLEPYKGSSTRHVCPSCGSRKSFARYIDENGNYLSDDVGRCNHETGCGFHRTPKDYYTEHPDKKKRSDKIQIAPPPPPREPDFLPSKLVEQSRSNASHFFEFLVSLVGYEQADKVASLYRLGATKDGSVIFWQIDEAQRTRTGKIMKYNPKTGKRCKNDSMGIDWVHSKMKRAAQLPEDFNLQQCLFGEHLLTGNEKPIAIVESEKTALIASCFLPQYLWIGTGGLQNLSVRTTKPLRGRRILLFPDCDAVAKWEARARELNAFGCYNLVVVKDFYTAEHQGTNTDLADILISAARG